jgi:hypothetical protein
MGDFETERQPAKWARYRERGDSWPCNLPEFKRWRRVSCDKLRPVRAFRATPRQPDQKSKCLWVWGESEERWEGPCCVGRLTEVHTGGSGEGVTPARRRGVGVWSGARGFQGRGSEYVEE